MSEKFVASNGMVLAPHVDGSVRWEAGFNPKVVTAALREFFLHERDAGLGRWRWPDDPRYLVFPLKDDDEVRVLDENSGQSVAIRRSSFRPGLTHTHFVGAALAYFDTHPEPKPAWHDAKPGEAWVLTCDDGREVAQVVDAYRCFMPWTIAVDSGGNNRGTVVSARRIFPEVVSDDS